MTSKVRKILALGIGTLVIVGGIGISGIKSGVGEADMVSIGNEPVAMSGEDPDEIEELETEEPEEEPEEDHRRQEVRHRVGQGEVRLHIVGGRAHHIHEPHREEREHDRHQPGQIGLFHRFSSLQLSRKS